MNIFKMTIPLLLAGAVAAHAGEPVIVETESGISVVYDGSAAQAEPNQAAASASAAATTAAVSASQPAKPGQLARARFLSAQLQLLDREIREASQMTGNETEAELAARRALIADKRSTADRYAAEYRQVTGTVPPDPAEAQEAPAAASYTQSPFLKQRNDREERIRNTRSMHRGMGSSQEP